MYINIYIIHHVMIIDNHSFAIFLAGTDDGDLKFNYLSNFGPRFRKLADMYGEEPSDEESDGVGERESESWC